MSSEIYLFPFKEIVAGSRVVIYGAGVVGRDYIREIRKTEYCEIAYVIDENYLGHTQLSELAIDIYDPSVLTTRRDYDSIVIATVNDSFREEMRQRLNELGVDDDCVISCTPRQLVMRGTSYSQHGEDMIIYFAFKHMGFFRDGKLPSYIDVGAHHPFRISNTALFHELGCKGINIEANPMLIEEFKKERPNDINLCVGIGPKEGTFPFYISDVLGLNTFKRENLSYNEFLVEVDTGEKKKYDVKDVIELPVRRLNDIISEYWNGIWPDFMSMDIEGMEYETIEDSDLSNGPALIALEVNYDGDLFIDLLRKKGYFPYLWYRENILFVRNDYETLVHAHSSR